MCGLADCCKPLCLAPILSPQLDDIGQNPVTKKNARQLLISPEKLPATIVTSWRHRTYSIMISAIFDASIPGPWANLSFPVIQTISHNCSFIQIHLCRNCGCAARSWGTRSSYRQEVGVVRWFLVRCCQTFTHVRFSHKHYETIFHTINFIKFHLWVIVARLPAS